MPCRIASKVSWRARSLLARCAPALSVVNSVAASSARGRTCSGSTISSTQPPAWAVSPKNALASPTACWYADGVSRSFMISRAG